MPEVLELDTSRIVPGPNIYDHPALRDTRQTGSGESFGELVRDAKKACQYSKQL